VAVLAGIALYVVLKEIGIAQWIITASVVLVMLCYAAAVTRIPRLRVRLDQAGDNAYYLGLLFTLASMAFALYDSGSPNEDGPETRVIVANFGIALASTITGIFLRVLLHQMRIDPAEVESATRMELAEASRRVRATLDSLSSDSAALLDVMRQRTSDQVVRLGDEIEKTVAKLTSDVSAQTRRLVSETDTAHTGALAHLASTGERLVQFCDEAGRAIERLEAVEPPSLKLATRLERTTAALESLGTGIGEATNRIAAAADNLEHAGTAASSTSTQLAAAAKALVDATTKSSEQQHDSLALVTTAAERVSEAITHVGDVLEAETKILVGMEEQAKASANASADAQKASKAVLDELVRSTKQLTALVNRAD
jgi:hypothetical protein